MIEKIREGLYVKKSFDGYRVVYPIKTEDGKVNWFNLFTGGNYWKLIKTIIILLLILGISYSYYRDTKVCMELIENPCPHFFEISEFCLQNPNQIDFNFEGVIVNGNKT
jgi:hypothetical protein